MLKAKQYEFKDSNVADIGSAMDKAQREAAAKNEPAWEGAGQEVGVKVWRVEKFEIKEWPKEEYGTFFDGDAYIVLKTYKEGDALRWNIYFWLGADCSQDEAGTAAYKTVELDDHLGGAPVQIREVMGFESKCFLDLWSPSMTILSGGMESGFNRVQAPEDYAPRLMRIKQAKRKISTFQVPLSNKSLNTGDVYILDKGLTIFQWNGPFSSGFERNRAAQIVHALKGKRKGGVKVGVLQGEDPNADFHAMLEDGVGEVLSKEDAEAADDEKTPENVTATYRLSDESGEMTAMEVGPIRAFSTLENRRSDVFILDNATEVFVWVGSGASPGEKRHAVPHAQKFLADHARPFLPIFCMAEGHESALFKAVAAC